MSRIAVAGAAGLVGRLLVEALRAGGHEAIEVSRSHGFDLTQRGSLGDALVGCDAVVDVTSVATLATRPSIAFFTTVTEHLLAAEHEAGVGHHVALSIVGAAQSTSGYYAGKAAQERIITTSDQGWSLLRATQFHEFAVQTLARGTVLGAYVAPKMRCQPVAAIEVAARLAEIATGEPAWRVADLAGPTRERMADLMRRYLAVTGQRGRVLEVRLPGSMGAILADGRLIPGPDAAIGRITFDDWLASLRHDGESA